MKKLISLLSIVIVLFSTILYSQNKIISTGDEWEYYDDKISPDEDWKTTEEPISGWLAGPSPLGYGNSQIKTEIRYGASENKKNTTAYFKKTFRIENPFDCIAYKLGVLKDDGAIIYLNGREIMRINMPDGLITNKTTASNITGTQEAERYVHSKILTSDDFKVGYNIIAVSVHQANEYSSDIIFSLELTCENSPEMIPQLLREHSIKNTTLDYKIKELENKLGSEKKDTEIKTLIKGNENFKNLVIVLLIVLLIIISIVIYLLSRYSKKNISFKKKITILKNTSFNKSQELMSASMQALQNQQLLKETKSSLEETLNEKPDTIKKEIKRLIRQIDFNIEQDDDWLKLLNHFNAINSGYLDRLTNKHPSLSETELRHCVFIKLHMQTKEIAKILNIDPRSVQAARYRIKKKMGLEEQLDLRNYLQNF